MTRPRQAVAALAAVLMLVVGSALAGSPSPKTVQVSKTSAGVTADGESGSPSVSASGRHIAFDSEAANLPGSDSDDSVYVFNRKTRRTVLVSKTSDGEPASDGGSGDPAISDSGRYIAFRSGAANLPAGAGFGKIYVHDRKTGRTALMSKTSGGEPDNTESHSHEISGSGRFVSFFTTATNFPGNSPFGQIYVHDRETRKTRLVSKTSGGEPGDELSRPDHGISRSGRYIAFNSRAANLPGDTENIYVHDRKTRKTRLVSKTSGGEPTNGFTGNPAVSASGRFVAFGSNATNLPGDDSVWDVFVHDRKTEKTRLVSKTSAGAPATGGDSDYTLISASGRYVGFTSTATNLPGNDSVEDVYIHDRKTGRTRLVTKDSAGVPASGGDSFGNSISASGKYLAFSSEATNLPGDDLYRDAYVRGPLR